MTGGFGINFNNKPVIREAANMQNDGGAGNLGYFERGEGERKEKESEIDSVFIEGKNDSFGADEENSETEDFSIAKFIAQLILSIKNWFKKTFLAEDTEDTSTKTGYDHFDKETKQEEV